MVGIQVSSIKHSTVGSSMTVTINTELCEVGFIYLLHDFLKGYDMSFISVEAAMRWLMRMKGADNENI